MYLMGTKSLTHLCSFLCGYECGRADASEKAGDQQYMQFHAWLAKRLGYEGTAMNPYTQILKRAQNDERAFKMFFELIDEFNGQKGGSTGSRVGP